MVTQQNTRILAEMADLRAKFHVLSSTPQIPIHTPVQNPSPPIQTRSAHELSPERNIGLVAGVFANPQPQPIHIPPMHPQRAPTPPPPRAASPPRNVLELEPEEGEGRIPHLPFLYTTPEMNVQMASLVAPVGISGG